MSETRARARRFACWLGSLARNGLMGARRAGALAATAAPAGAAGAAGRLCEVSPLAARGAKLGRSPVSRFAGMGGAFETVGRIGDGSPPRDGPLVGPARPAVGGTAG